MFILGNGPGQEQDKCVFNPHQGLTWPQLHRQNIWLEFKIIKDLYFFK